jgi:gamma-glutamyltranspeptidase/glutathione hydrolase
LKSIIKNGIINLVLCVFILSCTPQRPIKAAVVSARIEASNIGVRIMQQGGNAFDAAVATHMALAVCYPNAGNLGGGGFAVIRTASGTVSTLDFREKAPLNAFRDMYLDENQNVIPGKSTLGGLAVGVPGSVAGLYALHQKGGKLPWAEVIKPAQQLAEIGFIVTSQQAKVLAAKRDEISSLNGTETLFARPLKEKDTIRNLALAKFLNRIAYEGPNAFYSGTHAQAVIKTVKANGGVFTLRDLESYIPVWRDPIVFKYKDLTIYSMGPPSSGGICLAQLMGMIEPYPLSTYGIHSEKALQLMIEAEKRSFADRSLYLGDSDFVTIPSDQLIDATYLKERMKTFSFEEATPSNQIAPGQIVFEESNETTHFSVLDSQGNAIALTTTLNGNYGSKLYVEDGGYFLNNEMDDFSSKPGVPNMFELLGGAANAIAPGKRMLSAMTPTIVERNGKLSMVLGTPGGSTIITSIFQILMNVYEFGLTLDEAVSAPRFHHQWLPDEVILEPNKFSKKTIKNLTKKGYKIQEKQTRIIGRVDAIYQLPNGTISVASDPRGDDAPAVIR